MILKNQELHFVFINPAKPRKSFDGKKYQWEFQVRTKDKAVRKQWLDMGLDPKSVRTIRADKTDDESPILYYCTTFRKSAEPREKAGKLVQSMPIQVVDGKQRELDVGIGSGTIANILLYEREYDVGGIKKKGFTPTKLQIVKLHEYKGGDMEDFEDEFETEVIDESAEGGSEDDKDMY